MKLLSEIPEKERSLYKVMDLWYLHNISGRLAPNTCRMYSDTIRRIKTHAADMPVKAINEERMQIIINKVANAGYANSTVSKCRLVLSNITEFAVRIKWLDTLPLFKLFVPKSAPTKVVDALDIETQIKVEEYCRTPKNQKYGDVVLFILNTGLRISELFNLKWCDIKAISKYTYMEIRVSKTKNGIRCVPLNSEALKIIQRQPHINEYVFTTITGEQLSQTQMKRFNAKLRSELNIETFTNHICRHTFATRALEKGMEINALSKIMGHSSPAFTMQRYTTVFNEYLFAQRSIFERA